MNRIIQQNLRPPRKPVPAVALLADIHSNLPALEAVLFEAWQSGAGSIAVLGDTVGYGASPSECVAMVRKLGADCVMGNHDVEIDKVRKRGCTFSSPGWKYSEYLAGLALAARSLDAEQAQWLKSLPFHIKIPGAVVAHGSLDEPQAFNRIVDAKSGEPTLRILRGQKSKVGFFGHTHVQGIFADDPAALEWLDETQVRIPTGLACAVTVGAVGRPHNDPEQRAAWVIWDPDTGVVQFKKTEYNRIEAARAIAKAGLPMESSLVLLTGEEINDLFNRE